MLCNGIKCGMWLLFCSVGSHKGKSHSCCSTAKFFQERNTWDKISPSGHDPSVPTVHGAGSNPAGTSWSSSYSTNCNQHQQDSVQNLCHLGYPSKNLNYSLVLSYVLGYFPKWLFERKEWKHLWSWAVSIAPSVPNYTATAGTPKWERGSPG